MDEKFPTRVVFKMTPADAYCDSECIAFLLDVEDVNAGLF